MCTVYEGDAKKYVGVPGMNSISNALCNESGPFSNLSSRELELKSLKHQSLLSTP